MQSQVSREAFLTTAYGQPFASSGGLDNRIRDWVIEAGLNRIVEVRNKKTKETEKKKKATRSQHGIRKMVALEIAHAGGSVYEIMARLSHSDTRSAAPYTVDFERAELNKASAARVAAAKAKARSVPRPENRGTHGVVSASEITIKGEKWQPVGESNPSFQVENLTS